MGFNSRKNKRLTRRYGITESEYDEMLRLQSFACAICKIHFSHFKRPLSVDHCHNSTKVRGLLCSTCNTGLGMFKDNVEILKRAIHYLKAQGK